jgi:hypothetical protein
MATLSALRNCDAVSLGLASWRPCRPRPGVTATRVTLSAPVRRHGDTVAGPRPGVIATQLATPLRHVDCPGLGPVSWRPGKPRPGTIATLLASESARHHHDGDVTVVGLGPASWRRCRSRPSGPAHMRRQADAAARGTSGVDPSPGQVLAATTPSQHVVEAMLGLILTQILGLGSTAGP